MALSETFSGSCGILTLDEPTTNLDTRNKKYLAKTLTEMVAAKQETASSFQLVVITHDEEFVQELMEVDAVSEYVRVERDPRGKSRVFRQVVDGSVPDLGMQRGDKRNKSPTEFDYD